MFTPPGNVGVVQVDVDVVKEVMAHKVDIALVTGDVQAHILVQIDASDLAEIQIALFISRNELLIGADGAGAGGQPRHAAGLQNDLGRDDAGCLTAHVVIVFCGYDPHGENACLTFSSQAGWRRPWTGPPDGTSHLAGSA